MGAEGVEIPTHARTQISPTPGKGGGEGCGPVTHSPGHSATQPKAKRGKTASAFWHKQPQK